MRVLYSTGRSVLQSFMPKIEAKLDVSPVMPLGRADSEIQLAIVGLVCLKDELYLCRHGRHACGMTTTVGRRWQWDMR